MTLRWAWWTLTLLAVLTGAYATRYAPAKVGSFEGVWDRWGHRYCLLVPDHGWVCGTAPR